MVEAASFQPLSLIFALLLSLSVYWIAKRNGYFALQPFSGIVPVTFYQALGGFLVYLLFAMVTLPIFLVFLSFVKTGSFFEAKQLPAHWLEWIQVAALYVLFLLLVLYCTLLKPTTRHYIFWQQGEKSFNRFAKAVGMGALTWLVSFPFVWVVSIAIEALSVWIWGEKTVEQVAVKQLKLTLGHPLLFAFMFFAVAILVPFMEEFLFRGLLQNFIKRHLGRGWAIVITAVIFAFAHFSMSQGVGNFQLIPPLLVLAFFLCFLYERERTLWAPMALHMTFNTLSAIMIVFSS